MLELKSLALQDFLMWKDQSFDFLPGVTMIGGENRSGKTLFFIRGITTALWGADAAKRGTDASKMPEGSKSIAKFACGGHDWAVTATSSRVSLVRDGKTLGLSGKKTGRAQFQELFGGPMDLYDSSIMVSCSKPNPLVLAPPLQRADWFGSLFGIDAAIEQAQAGVSEALGKMRKEKTELTFLEEQLATLREERVAPAKRALDATELSALQKQQRRNDKRIRDYQHAISLLKSMSDFDKDKLLPDQQVDTLEMEAVNLRAAIADARVKAETARKLASAIARRKDLKQQIKRMEAFLAKSPIDADAARALDKFLRPIDEKLERLNARSDEYEEKLRKATTGLKVSLDKLGGEPSDAEIEDAVKNYDAIYEQAAIASNESRKLGRDVKGNVCPHCGSKVDGDILKTKKAALEDARKKADKALSRAHAIKSFVSYRDEVDALRLKAPNPVLHRFVDGMLGRAITVWKFTEDIGDMRKELARLPEPQKIPSVKAVDDLVNSLAKVEKRLAEHREQADIKESNVRVQGLIQEIFDSPHRVYTPKDISMFEGELKRCRAKVEPLKERIDRAEQANAVLDNIDSRIEKLETKIAAIKKGVGDLPLMETLGKAFGRSGLRMTRISELVDAFEATVNEGASLLLPDGYSFRMSTSETGVDIRYRRPDEVVSDLSVLSGSEDKCWRLLCALALVRMCPNNMRCDTIVLDEMESLMSAQSRERFAKDYMPVLAEAVSKVVVVSPMTSSQLPISFDRRFNVEMNKGVSRLVRQ